MNYILVLVVYSVLSTGVYQKRETQTWPLPRDLCIQLGKQALADPTLNNRDAKLTTVKCIPTPRKRKVFPQDEIQLPSYDQLNI